MDFLIEIVLEFLLEMGMETSKDKRVNKPIRYFLIAFISTFFIAVIGLVYLTSIISIKENILLAIVFFILATFILVGTIIKFKKIYIEKKKK